MVLARKKNLWFLFGLLIIATNIAIYHSTIGLPVAPSDAKKIAIGSLIDFSIMAPLAIMFAHDQFSIKKFIFYISVGCISARLIIPMEYLEPYLFVTWFGFVVEGFLLLMEIYLVLSIVYYLPRVLKYIKESPLPALFSVQEAVERHIRSHFFAQVITAELVMFYYALATWRQKAPAGITLHKKSSYFALQIMLIHAIVLETIGIHWWLHEVSPILSFILLILNIYSILFFLGDIQAMRLTPILFEENHFYISYGLMKKAKIRYDSINEIILEKAFLEQKLSKKILSFIVRDFEILHPQVILKMKEPVVAIYHLGIQKKYEEVAIRVDDLTQFLQQLEQKRK